MPSSKETICTTYLLVALALYGHDLRLLKPSLRRSFNRGPKTFTGLVEHDNRRVRREFKAGIDMAREEGRVGSRVEWRMRRSSFGVKES